MLRLLSFLGIFFFIALAILTSKNRKYISKRTIVSGLCLQILLVLLVLGIPTLGVSGPLQFMFQWANIGILELLKYTEVGSSFIFGDLASSEKGGFVLAFQVLPIIIFISSLMTVLYHIGIMQFIVHFFSILMQKLLNVSGAESLAAAANVFVGQTEAPLIIRPYLKKMTESELFSLMTGGMATIAGSVMAVYFNILKNYIPDIGGHLLTASILSAPAALVVAKIMIPETQTPETLGKTPKRQKKEYVNIVEAAAAGASEGLKLAANVAAMLLAFIALIAMLDGLIIQFGDWISFNTWGQSITPEIFFEKEQAQLSLSLILSWLFTPIAFFLGIPWEDLQLASSLIGKKIVFNEFIAYVDLAKLGEQLKPRTLLILSYALCGFANFASMAIQLGGIGPLIPERKSELARLGLRSVLGGCLAAFITASIAGVLT